MTLSISYYAAGAQGSII